VAALRLHARSGSSEACAGGGCGPGAHAPLPSSSLARILNRNIELLVLIAVVAVLLPFCNNPLGTGHSSLSWRMRATRARAPQGNCLAEPFFDRLALRSAWP